MKVKVFAVLLIGVFVFTSLTAFGAEANIANNKTVSAGTISNTLFANNFNMEYCTVDLNDRSSNLNVRTWEGRVVGKLRHGTSVFVNEYSGEWARVSVRRGRRWVAIGWVDSTYLVC
jgi:hypothetical protein